MKYWLIVTAGICLAQSALAAAGPPTTVMLGSAGAIDASGPGKYRCASVGGPAGFQRGAASTAVPNPPAIISLPAVAVSAAGGGVSYTGTVLLRFTSATGGTASFDYNQNTLNAKLPSGKAALFSGYSQVWTASAGTLKVTFNIQFPNCAVPVAALFRTIP